MKIKTLKNKGIKYEEVTKQMNEDAIDAAFDSIISKFGSNKEPKFSLLTYKPFSEFYDVLIDDVRIGPYYLNKLNPYYKLPRFIRIFIWNICPSFVYGTMQVDEIKWLDIHGDQNLRMQYSEVHIGNPFKVERILKEMEKQERIRYERYIDYRREEYKVDCIRKANLNKNEGQVQEV